MGFDNFKFSSLLLTPHWKILSMPQYTHVYITRQTTNSRYNWYNGRVNKFLLIILHALSCCKLLQYSAGSNFAYYVYAIPVHNNILCKQHFHSLFFAKRHDHIIIIIDRHHVIVCIYN